jgi:pimeloyl-ACP methyl ester carboxylesterase
MHSVRHIIVEVPDMPEIQLTQGTIHYRDEGSGPVVVLIHGLLVNSSVWAPLIHQLEGQARCIAPDLPLGSHPRAMNPGADLSPAGLAALIAEFLEKLDIDEVTLVGNDTGGALCQLVCVNHPARIARLVLVNCDAFENFPPKAFRPVVKVLGRVPGALAQLEFFGRLRTVRERSMALMPLTVEPVPDELLKAWVSPLRDRGVRRDLTHVLRAISPRYTLDAAERLRGFDRPALVVWGLRDKFFPLEEGERLAATLPNARLERVENARTFVQLDAPARLAELVAQFASDGAAVRSSAA